MKQLFQALDTVRTLLAVGVAVGHYLYWNGTATLYPRAFFLAVDFFFVLSGFVLAQTVFFDRATTLDAFVKAFAWRRIVRLFPLYLVLFLASTAVLVLKPGGAADPAYYYLLSAVLLQAMGFDAGAIQIFADTSIGIAWSISVEFWVGLMFFPLVYALRGAPAVLVALCAAIIIIGLALLANFSPNGMDVNLQRVGAIFTFGSVRGLIGFATGTAAFILLKAISERRLSSWTVSLLEIALIGLCVALFVPNGHDTRNDFLAAPIFAMLIVILALQTGVVSKLFSARIWSPVRPISYSIYLVHPLVVLLWRTLNLPFSHWLLIPYVALTVASAWILYHSIELPALRLGKNRKTGPI